ncbi:transposase family protein [Streptomyces sp. NPDC001663]|uniref:transposase family protein n=1 Tax=Streptomyces sp. NPDC001663 TaxID=3364597 RepID=UPI003699E49D
MLWVSAARPGRTSEIAACRHDQLTARLGAAGLGAIADLGFVGLDDREPGADPAVITGYKAARNDPLTRGQKLSNKVLAAVRAPVEHGFGQMSSAKFIRQWPILGVRQHEQDSQQWVRGPGRPERRTARTGCGQPVRAVVVLASRCVPFRVP